MAVKVWIHVDNGDGDEQRVCWYMGTSDIMIENAIRMLLRLPSSTRFLLRDADGDLVPVSATVPHGQVYQLVAIDQDGVTAADHISGTISSYHLMDDDDSTTEQQPPHPKRRRRRRIANGAAAASHTTNDTVEFPDDSEPSGHQPLTTQQDSSIASFISPQPITSAAPPANRPRSIVHLVLRFLETFTRPISNDDNVNFIPSTGAYALYALYISMFTDTSYHPKSQNAFYKMTSTQGKVDRQRVIRHYQHVTREELESDDPYVGVVAEYVVCKPEGKGLLLRKYVHVPNDISASELVRASSFVHVLDLDPQKVVAQYLAFVRGFCPISRAVFQSHTKTTM